MDLYLKHTLTSLLFSAFCTIFVSSAFSQDNTECFEGLVLEQLNNEELVEGDTYRLYAHLSCGVLVNCYSAYPEYPSFS